MSSLSHTLIRSSDLLWDLLHAHLPALPKVSHTKTVLPDVTVRHLCLLCSSSRPVETVRKTMVEQEPTSTAGQRLGAPETLGISTLEPGHKPPAMPSGRHVAIRVRMLDDSEEIFDVSVSASFILYSQLLPAQSKFQ